MGPLRPRAATAANLENKLHEWYTQIQGTGTQGQKNAIAKINSPNADGTVKATMVTVAKDGEANSLRVLAALWARPDASGSEDENPDDTPETAGDSDDEAKGNGKRARSPNLDNACGSSSKKARVISG
ncbi:hypothetical protein B0H19DRAFT_1245366 [Mycena capillaripes]|nr:hypothetical protein B0H19DRAFT_1245366 [Mycena capillaripes]